MLMSLQLCILFAMTLLKFNKLILICVISLTHSISADFFTTSSFAKIPWLCKLIGHCYFSRVFNAAVATCCEAAMQSLRLPHR